MVDYEAELDDMIRDTRRLTHAEYLEQASHLSHLAVTLSHQTTLFSAFLLIHSMHLTPPFTPTPPLFSTGDESQVLPRGTW